jgi:hypothetical protein
MLGGGQNPYPVNAQEGEQSKTTHLVNAHEGKGEGEAKIRTWLRGGPNSYPVNDEKGKPCKGGEGKIRTSLRDRVGQN